MEIFKFFGVACVLFFSSLAMPDDIPRGARNVIGLFDANSNKPINTNHVYGDVINHYIPDNVRNIVITIPNGINVPIDLGREIEFAISEWSASGIRFNRMASDQGVTRYIGYRLGNDG